MSDSQNNFQGDEKLKAFLKANHPEAPVPKRDQLEILLHRLNLSESAKGSQSKGRFGSRGKAQSWMSSMVAVAASVAAFAFVIQLSEVSLHTIGSDAVVEAAFEDYSDGIEALDILPDSTASVGEDYLAFVTE